MMDSTRFCDWLDKHRIGIRWLVYFTACSALGWFGEGWRLAHGYAPIMVQP